MSIQGGVCLTHRHTCVLEHVLLRSALEGCNRANHKAQEILDFIGQAYRETTALQAIGAAVGLSAYRVAHLIK